MALYGKALADQVPSSVTGNQARVAFGKMTESLHNAYLTLQKYDSTGIARTTGLDAGSVNAARQYLDGANDALQKYFLQMPASDSPLTDDQLTKFKVAVSTSSAAVKTIDDLFNTSFLSELFTNVGQSIVAVSSKVVGKVGEGAADIVWAFLKQTWWIFLLAGGAWIGVAYLQGRTMRALTADPSLQDAKRKPRGRARRKR
jgi:hypothetical protein